MAKTGLEPDIAIHATAALRARRSRDTSPVQERYLASIKQLTKDVEMAIETAHSDPELAILVSRACIRFTLMATPDPVQEPGRATTLSQCQALEDFLAKVRKPEQYLMEMRQQFGPDLDPRNYPTAQDAFHSTVRSQYNKISAEAKGLNSHIEQDFCRKRSALLRELEKSYTVLRAEALGIAKAPEKSK